MDVQIKQLPKRRVAFVRHTGPYMSVGAAWEKLCAWAGPRGLFGPQTMMIGVCYDDPQITPPDKIRYDACLTAGDHVQPEGEVGVQEIAAGEYAVTTHRGPYERLSETYAKLCGEWLPQSCREPSNGPSCEIYRNDPSRTKPEDLLTDICVPLAPATARI